MASFVDFSIRMKMCHYQLWVYQTYWQLYFFNTNKQIDNLIQESFIGLINRNLTSYFFTPDWTREAVSYWLSNHAMFGNHVAWNINIIDMRDKNDFMSLYMWLAEAAGRGWMGWVCALESYRCEFKCFYSLLIKWPEESYLCPMSLHVFILIMRKATLISSQNFETFLVKGLVNIQNRVVFLFFLLHQSIRGCYNTSTIDWVAYKQQKLQFWSLGNLSFRC